MLWGLTLFPGNVVKETVNYDVHLSMAALETRPEFISNSDGQAQVIVQTERGQFVVCTLVYGSILQQTLDMEIKAGEMVTLFSQGKGVIHLTGHASNVPLETVEHRVNQVENAEAGDTLNVPDRVDRVTVESENNSIGSQETVPNEVSDVVIIKEEPADSDGREDQNAPVTIETSEPIRSTTKISTKKKGKNGGQAAARASQSVEKPHTCPTCGKGFTQACNLKAHLRVHSGEKPFSCKTCHKTFADLGTVRRHEKIHSGDRPFLCGYCNKGFPEKAALVRHERIHSGEKPFPCRSCPKTFSDKGQRKRHERSHLEGAERAEYNGQCDECGKVLKDASSLRRHKLLHLDLKPYICQLCAKAFKDPSTLRQHYQMHDRLGGKQGMIQCINCPAQFGDIDEHNDHTANHCSAVDCSGAISVKIENVAMDSIDDNGEEDTDWLT